MANVNSTQARGEGQGPRDGINPGPHEGRWVNARAAEGLSACSYTCKGQQWLYLRTRR